MRATEWLRSLLSTPRPKASIGLAVGTVAVGLGAGLGAGAVGCGAPPIPLNQTCPEITCMEAFAVELERAGDWDAGQYELEVALEDEVLTCDLTLPPPCDADPPCAALEDLVVETSACDDPPALFRVGVAQGSEPEAVRVTVRFEDASLASRTFTPEYELSQPGGMGCLPFCSSAEPETLAIE